MNPYLTDGLTLTGLLTFENLHFTAPQAEAIDRYLESAHDLPPADFDALMRELKSYSTVATRHIKNLVVLSGRARLAGVLIGEHATGAINYGLLGTSDTAPDAADTVLGAEVKRKLFARRVRTDAQATFDFFYSKADVNGTFEEFGMVIDGTETANTGVLYNHALTGGWTKTSSEAMRVNVVINLNAS